MKTKTTKATKAKKGAAKKGAKKAAKKYADNKDRTKLMFNGKAHGKARVVQAIVEKFVEDHPKVTLDELQEKFPQSIHSMGLLQPLSKAKRLSKGHRRFYIDKPIVLNDGKEIAVCSEFGSNNIGKFLDVAKDLGYVAKPVK